MLTSTLVLAGLALIMGIVIFMHDRNLFSKGLQESLRNIKQQLPLLIMAFILVGFLEILLPVNFVQDYLGEESGLPGIIAASFMGAMIPAGPYIVFPLVTTMAVAGAGTPVIVAFITGWMMLSTSKLPFELSLMGPRFTLYRVSIFIIFPVLAGLLAQWFY